MQQWRMVSPPAVGVAGVLLLAVAMMTEVTAARGLKVLKTPVHHLNHLLALPLWQSHSPGQCGRLCACNGMLRCDAGKPDRKVRRGRTGSGRDGVHKLVALAKRS